MSTKIAIIGAGIAGLSAGCYLQMNGYETEIFESHNIPGGLCTSWERNGYIFDGCIHWLVGSNPSDNFYKLWNEILDMTELTFIDLEEFGRTEDINGKILRIYSDLDCLKKELLSVAPEDQLLITEFISAGKQFTRLKLPIEKAAETYTFLDGVKMFIQIFPYIRLIKKWAGISLEEFSQQCKNPLLGFAIRNMFTPQTSVFFVLMTLAWMHNKNAGYPIGGSLKFAECIASRYEALGGKINYTATVEKIIVENDRAKGIQMKGGQQINADMVISAADGHATLFDWLDAKYLSKKYVDLYNNQVPFPSLIQISLGINADLSDLPALSYFQVGKTLTIDPETSCNEIGLRILNFDPSLAPAHKTTAIVLFTTTNEQYWVNLRRENYSEYNAVKQRLLKQVIVILEEKYPQLAGKMEVSDIATPATYIRYTKNWKGSFEGWQLTPKMGLRQLPKSLKGLSNFYMCGQWVEPGGGLPAVMMSGRNVTQIICKRDGRKFKSC